MSQPELDRYRELQQQRPEWFNADDAPIRLLLDPADQQRAQEASRADFARRGLPSDWGTVGAVFEDRYVLVLRDAVRFAAEGDGEGPLGTYVRVHYQGSATNGVAVLPWLDGKVVLIRHFRHPTRTWEWEIPRGLGDPGQTWEQNARREVEEEIGAVVERLVYLGPMHLDTGRLIDGIDLVLAFIASIGALQRSEGIDDIRLLTPAEMEAFIAAGHIRDSFTLSAWAIAKAKNLIA